MSEIKNGGLDQHGAEAFKQQQFGTAAIKGVKTSQDNANSTAQKPTQSKVMVAERYQGSADRGK